VTFTLISRRSHHQGGTRFHARGIDDDGNVANMVETEQILQYQDYLFSFVSVRGSVPIFWTQEGTPIIHLQGINNTVKMTRSFDLTSAAFMRHSK
jgi:phosphatidylinositol-bisphosphatase